MSIIEKSMLETFLFFFKMLETLFFPLPTNNECCLLYVVSEPHKMGIVCISPVKDGGRHFAVLFSPLLLLLPT